MENKIDNSVKFFDTHCHYNLDPLLSRAETYRQQALSAGVTGAVIVGTNLDTSRQALTLKRSAKSYFRAAVGLHPELIIHAIEANYDLDAFVQEQLAQLAPFLTLPEVDALGEIGLDYYRLRTRPDLKKIMDYQEKLLIGQFQLAKNNDLPIIFHLRDEAEVIDQPTSAYLRLWRLLHDYDLTKRQLIFHCFSGSLAHLERILALPHSYISFAGNVTFKSAHQLRTLLTQVPPARLLLETDAPFLSPEPVRGRPCEPAFLAHTARLAASLGVNLSQVWQNSLTLFETNSV